MIAIIPARGGSKSIPKKNLVDLCGHPLLAYPIVRAKQCNKIIDVFVSTDDNEIADVAHKYGASIIYRPKELSMDSSSDIGWLRHAAIFLDIHLGDNSIIHLRATTPMITPSGLDLAINKWESKKDKYTSLVSVHVTPESVLKYYTLFDEILHPIDNNYSNQVKQNVPKTYKPNGYVEILKTSWFMNNDTARGNMIFPFETPITEEVDGPEELDYIRYLMNKPENERYKINY